MNDLQQNTLGTLQLLGLDMPTPAYLIGATIFSFIGLFAWWRGRRGKLPACKWIGIALMVYPLAVSDTLPLYAVGIALCVALYYWHDQ